MTATVKKEVKMQKKKLRELFKRERRKAATSNSPITINRYPVQYELFWPELVKCFKSSDFCLIATQG